MAILADFTPIRFTGVDNGLDGTSLIPYRITEAAALRIDFKTNGKVHNATGNRVDGILSLMVRGLTDANIAGVRSGTAEVRIKSENTGPNGHLVGRLQPFGTRANFPSQGFRDRHLWRHQQFLIGTNVLSADNRDDANQLIIGRVSTNQVFDDFQVADIVCHFHQDS